MKYYTRNVGDYTIDTGDLSMLEHGAYTLLTDFYYKRQTPIQASRVYNVCKAHTDAEREAVDYVLNSFFTLEGEHWRHHTCDEQIAKYLLKSEEAKQRGRKGGLAKAKRKASQEASAELANATDSAKKNGGSSVSKPETVNRNSVRQDQERKPRKRGIPPDFGISDRVRAWASEKGYDRLPEHLEHFRNKAVAKAYTYADWDEGFMGAIREDWARLRTNDARAGPTQSGGLAKVKRLEEMKRGLAAGRNPDGAPKALALALGEQPGD